MTSSSAPKDAPKAIDHLLRSPSVPPVHPVGEDGAFKLLIVADELLDFGRKPKLEKTK
jgi:hypothetical protein